MSSNLLVTQIGSEVRSRTQNGKKDKNDFTEHSQLHRRKITMLTTFNGHLFFSVYFRQTDTTLVESDTIFLLCKCYFRELLKWYLKHI